jgi:S-adenosylmethionine:tRNA-ribosyltransferase-isomerase (queuine synthetase)
MTYKHGVERIRFHLFEARCNLEGFQHLKGDKLKRTILEDIKKQIEKTFNSSKLARLKEEIMNSEKYEVLVKGQGLVTRVAQKIGGSRCVKTSSIKALESMFDEQERNLRQAL